MFNVVICYIAARTGMLIWTMPLRKICTRNLLTVSQVIHCALLWIAFSINHCNGYLCFFMPASRDVLQLVLGQSAVPLLWTPDVCREVSAEFVQSDLSEMRDYNVRKTGAKNHALFLMHSVDKMFVGSETGFVKDCVWFVAFCKLWALLFLSLSVQLVHHEIVHIHPWNDVS